MNTKSRIIIASITILTSLGISAGYSYATFFDNVTVNTNIIRAGSVDIQVKSTAIGASYDTASATSVYDVTGLYPGNAPIEAPAFWIKNSSNINPLTVTGQIASVAATRNSAPVSISDAQKSEMMIQLYDVDTLANESTPSSLLTWVQNPVTLTSTLTTNGQEKQYGIRTYLTTNADNEWNGVVLNFTLDMHAIMP